MKLVTISAIFTQLFLLFSIVHSHVIRENMCPPLEAIEPCTCSNNNLDCININEAEILRNVFVNSSGHAYNQVNISSSSLEYLPKELFEETSITNLILHRVTLDELFDSPPSSGFEAVDKVHIENTAVSMRMPWELLQNMTNLRLLNVYYNSIRTLDDNFSQFVSKSLQQVTFYSTDTRRILSDVFVDFVNLNKVTVNACQLTTLTRDIFPRPFNIRSLYFNDNKITSISEDLFTDMPNLQTLSLRDNLLSSIPESAFDGRISSISYVKLENNPLKCDCMLQWIVREKPEVLGGSCAGPKRLHGRQLRDLSTSHFPC